MNKDDFLCYFKLNLGFDFPKDALFTLAGASSDLRFKIILYEDYIYTVLYRPDSELPYLDEKRPINSINRIDYNTLLENINYGLILLINNP